MTDRKPTRKRGASLSISSIDPLVKIEYARLAVVADMTQAEFTRTLLGNYKCFNLDFSKEEQERLEVALQKLLHHSRIRLRDRYYVMLKLQ